MRTNNRLEYFNSAKDLLAVKPNVADRIVAEFEAASKDKVDPATNVRQLAKKYKLQLGDLTYIAIPILRIPDVKDPNARLPPSQHPNIAARLLLACSAAKEYLATLQILSAVYLSTMDGFPTAKDIVRLFSTAEIDECKRMLETLAEEGNTDAMTLQGQFLERAGQQQQAQALYEKALEKCDTKFNPMIPHPMAEPRMPPWTALGLMMQSKNTPQARAKAKAAFEKGAVKADDPLAYYHLASFENGRNTNWLKYMNKAAASGHLEAQYNLANFYMDVGMDKTALSKDRKITRAITWMTQWRQGSADNLAREWFKVAADSGHKPSMLELAELYGIEGDEEKSKDYLRRMAESPPAKKTEKWPQLAELARKRLAGVKIAFPRPV
ncbi:hypothetical protein BU26DRAFT_428321 [Trematosphaeria pertusa]|uniref:HCP-like protein n=1 Tax=Trematosphaeria pertusa TaxID=390896 RepID=A0A6A6ICN6_9PLEO|nr:uncharacterized protein BU26DRAFT_428321 [Trematosphaeria pertusa]KAF2248344.1 hypothetical protein BU26DRAFT_428321 [Trematosphaeria pertusa]